MSSDSTLDIEAQQQAQHDYSPDADNTALVSDYESGISELDLSTADEATMDALIVQNQNRLGFNFGASDAATGVTDTALDIGLYTAGSGLKTVSAAAGTLISDVAAMSGSDTIGERLASWATTNLAPTAKIAAADLGAVGGFMTEHAGDIAIYSAVSEVLHSDHPALTGLETGTALGVGVAVFAATAPEDAALSVGSYAFATIESALASATVANAWSAIEATVAFGQAHSWSISDMAAAAQSDFDSAYASIMGSTGSTATTNLGNISAAAGDIADALGHLGPDLGLAPPIADAVAGALSNFAGAVAVTDPLVIDLSSGHTGITLTTFDAATTSTFFDMTASGFAQQTAWTSGTTGFLVDDLNSNGKIDNATEMFGSNSADGFAQLATLDSNHDLKIDANDAAWSNLQVWIDANDDGVTQSGELHSLSSLGIVSIDLAGVTPSTSSIDGNAISHTSSVTFSDSSTGDIADVWLATDPANTYYNGDYTLDTDTLAMPDLHGYGSVADLTIAMSQDSTLKSMVSDLVTEFQTSGFAASTLDSNFDNILYQWAGVSSVDSSSRGPYVDARQLEFIEHLLGSTFAWVHDPSDTSPNGRAADEINIIWQQLSTNFREDVILQMGGGSLFANPVSYNPWTGTTTGDTSLSHAAIDALATAAPTDATANVAYWTEVGHFVDVIKGLDNVTGTEDSWLNDAVTSTNSSLSWDDIASALGGTISLNVIASSTDNDTITGTDAADQITAYGASATIHGGNGNDVIQATSGHNTIYGDAGDDVIHAGSGGDILYGGDGNDSLYGFDGDDTLNGGTGGNLLEGAAGNDTYVYGGGDDLIADGGGGTDKIVMPSGVTLGDVSFSHVLTDGDTNFYDLLITVAGSGTIQIQEQFNPGNSSSVIETLEFSDSSTVDLTSLTNVPYVGSSGDDEIDVPWGSGNSVVLGMAGNDILTVHDGNNTLDGGPGNDTMNGGTGDDTFVASPGYDIITEHGGTDTIQIAAGFTADDVTLFFGPSTPSDALVVQIAGLGEIQINDQFTSSDHDVEQIHFLADNSYLSIISAMVSAIGTTGDDTIYAPTVGVGGTIFDGRGGDDNFIGGVGNNVVLLSAGFGNVLIENPEGTGTNAIHFSGVDPANIRMWTDGFGDLHIQDTTDISHSITVDASYTGDGNSESTIGQYLAQITFDDVAHTTWDMTGGLHLTGDNSGDYLFGTPFGDVITGGSGDDNIYGNGGDDILIGGGGNNNLDGGDGNNTVDYGNATSAVTVDLSAGTASDNGLGGSDTLTNIQNVNGSSNADTITGDSNDNVLYGGGGNDTMTGGAGADAFLFKGATAFTGSATITDFNTGQGDKIDISDVLQGHFHPLTDAIADFVQLTTSGSNTLLKIDLDGSGMTHSPTTIATIEGITGLSLSTLITDHHLIIPT